MKKESAIGKAAKAAPSGHRIIRLTINGKPYELMVGKDIKASHTLAYTLRDTLGLTGTKIACDHGGCCSCTVIMDGEPVLSCITLTVECDGKSIKTVEGLKDPKTGELSALQQSFIDHTAFQCGFCTPGLIVTAQALLDKNPEPSSEEDGEALSGNFCRCISHYEVIEAVKDAHREAAKNKAEAPSPGGYRHIGKGTARGDAVEIVSGTAAYISDLRMPEMLYGKILKSPHPHANIIEIDTAGAKKCRACTPC